MCKVCGSDKSTSECCPLSPGMPLDEFRKAVFGPMSHWSWEARSSVNYVPYATVKEFYSDYRSSGLTLTEYVVSSGEVGDVHEIDLGE
jgi:hypothetical protein